MGNKITSNHINVDEYHFSAAKTALFRLKQKNKRAKYGKTVRVPVFACVVAWRIEYSHLTFASSFFNTYVHISSYMSTIPSLTSGARTIRRANKELKRNERSKGISQGYLSCLDEWQALVVQALIMPIMLETIFFFFMSIKPLALCEIVLCASLRSSPVIRLSKSLKRLFDMSSRHYRSLKIVIVSLSPFRNTDI